MSDKPKTFSPNKVVDSKKFHKSRKYESSSWAEYRIKFISANPRCYACGEPARVVDHIVAHKDDEEKFWDVYNFLPLCKKDHDTVTALFDRHALPKTEEKLKWINDKRLITNTSVRVKIVQR